MAQGFWFFLTDGVVVAEARKAALSVMLRWESSSVGMTRTAMIMNKKQVVMMLMQTVMKILLHGRRRRSYRW